MQAKLLDERATNLKSLYTKALTLYNDHYSCSKQAKSKEVINDNIKETLLYRGETECIYYEYIQYANIEPDIELTVRQIHNNTADLYDELKKCNSDEEYSEYNKKIVNFFLEVHNDVLLVVRTNIVKELQSYNSGKHLEYKEQS